MLTEAIAKGVGSIKSSQDLEGLEEAQEIAANESMVVKLLNVVIIKKIAPLGAR